VPQPQEAAYNAASKSHTFKNLTLSRLLNLTSLGGFQLQCLKCLWLPFSELHVAASTYRAHVVLQNNSSTDSMIQSDARHHYATCLEGATMIVYSMRHTCNITGSQGQRQEHHRDATVRWSMALCPLGSINASSWSAIGLYQRLLLRNLQGRCSGTAQLLELSDSHVIVVHHVRATWEM
jgi:hypothetical protein